MGSKAITAGAASISSASLGPPPGGSAAAAAAANGAPWAPSGLSPQVALALCLRVLARVRARPRACCL